MRAAGPGFTAPSTRSERRNSGPRSALNLERLNDQANSKTCFAATVAVLSVTAAAIETIGCMLSAPSRCLRYGSREVTPPRIGAAGEYCKVILPHYNLPSENEVSIPVRVRP